MEIAIKRWTAEMQFASVTMDTAENSVKSGRQFGQNGAVGQPVNQFAEGRGESTSRGNASVDSESASTVQVCTLRSALPESAVSAKM